MTDRQTDRHCIGTIRICSTFEQNPKTERRTFLMGTPENYATGNYRDLFEYVNTRKTFGSEIF